MQTSPFTTPWPSQGQLSPIHQGQMSEHLLPNRCSSCTWTAQSRRIPRWKLPARREVKGGGNQLRLSLCLCWIPPSASRGQGRQVLRAGSLRRLIGGPVRTSPAKISSSGDGTCVQAGEKAVMLRCKPIPIAAEPAGTRAAMLGVSRQQEPAPACSCTTGAKGLLLVGKGE